MEIDLAAVEAPIEAVRSQVCVVGAGIAGLMLAHKLMQQGIEVVLLEAGGREIDEDGQWLFAEAERGKQSHAGTSDGPVRAFGGTSLRWGGQLLGMSREAASEWPIAWEELTVWSAEAERLLGVDELPFEGAEFFTAADEPLPPLIADLDEVNARLSKWMAFSQRNLASTVGRELIAHPEVRVYLHAQATELLMAVRVRGLRQCSYEELERRPFVSRRSSLCLPRERWRHRGCCWRRGRACLRASATRMLR